MKNIKQKKSICVFCGSKHGNSTIYKDATLELGAQLAKNEIKLVYGGGSLGLMGELSKSGHRNKGEVLGVIPKNLLKIEGINKNHGEIIITDDMHKRKKTMYENADAFLCLPGGIGTLEEVSFIGGSKPVVTENIVIISYSSGEIYALDHNDGTLIWFDNVTSGNFFNKSSLNDIQSPISIVGDKVFVPSFSDKFIAYEISNGNKIWNLKLSSINPFVVSGGSIYLIDTLGRLLCVDKMNGKLLWAVQLKVSNDGEEVSWYGPLLSSNKLILNNSDGQVISISPFTGKLLSKINFYEELVSNPINIGDQIILISKKGTLFILG